MYSMINKINTAECYVWKLKVNSECSSQKNFFPISLKLYLYEMIIIYKWL